MLLIPKCYERMCKHFAGVTQSDQTEKTEVNVCSAFPEGIPNEIAYGENEHISPVDGDNGILFEKVSSYEDMEFFKK